MNIAFCLTCVMLVPLAPAGLSLIHFGLGRSRSSAHAMLATLCALAVAAILFVLFGSGFAGFADGASHSFAAFGFSWNWLGAEPWFAQSLDVGKPINLPAALILCCQMFAVGLTAIIPISSGTDRWRLGPICLCTAVLSGLLYPLFAHWVWGGGWLAQLGVNFSLGSGVLDYGGAGCIQVLGGLGALSIAWIVGPRRGKYSRDGTASAIPGHNIPLVLFGCILALSGWTALNAAGAMLFYNAGLDGIVRIVVNTMLTASASALAVAAVTQIRYRKPDASLTANGWIAGLVAGSAGCASISPAASVVIGVVAGIFLPFLIETLELKLLIDDPGGAISVHAGAGIWGLCAAGLFAQIQPGHRLAQLTAQLVCIATLLGCVLPLIHATNWILNRFVPFRTDASGDWQGMDIRELGAGAYPEFVIHADEFTPQ